MTDDQWLYISLSSLGLFCIYGLYRIVKSIANSQRQMEIKQHSDSMEIHLFIGS
jgi:hypothetical protein